MSELVLRKLAVAAAFPDLFDDDDNNNENPSDEESSLDFFSFSQKNGSDEDHSLTDWNPIPNTSSTSSFMNVSPNSSIYSNDTNIVRNNNNKKQVRFLTGQQQQDDAEQPTIENVYGKSTSRDHLPSSDSRMESMDDSYGSTSSLSPLPNKRKTTLLDVLFLGLLLVAIAASPVIVSLLDHKRPSNAVASVVDPQPTQEIDFGRVQAIREWVGVDDNSGDAQQQAVYWLADRDLSYILGETIPSKQAYDDYETLYEGDWFMDEAHENLEAFRARVTQRYAILVLAFANQVFVPKGGWLSLSGERLHECIWPGIECENGKIVTELKFDRTVGLLKGTLPTEIGLLSNLDSLRISNSNLNATLSRDIGKLSNLEYIDIRNGRFGGSIPKQLGRLSKLQYLYFANNDFTGTVPLQLGSLTQLKVLTLEHNGLLQSTLPRSICNLTSFFFLETLSANCLGGTAELASNDELLETNQTTTPAMTCDCCTNCF